MSTAHPTVAVVGAGFCGAVAALHLARLGLGVLLLDRGGRFGPGLAYGAARPLHLLNTPAGRMSAFVDDPEPWRSTLRFAFCKRDEVLDEAVARLAAWIGKQGR